MLIVAIREAEPWTGASIAAGVILLLAAVGALYWALRRYLDEP